ncbi:DUF1090 domain-containing protein [Orbaceae bacterium ESL0727]|nr:DUF1090 domain-containing protein [Orbaceae bacterium ESL0727]
MKSITKTQKIVGKKRVGKLAVMTLVVALCGTVYSAQVYAANHDRSEGTTCANKKQLLQTKIDEAKQHNNSYQVAGLEKALSDVNNYCKDSDLETKYKKQVQDKTDEVAERMKELKAAQLKGDAEKMAKQEAKLLKDKAELTEAQSKLAQYYKDLKAN